MTALRDTRHALLALLLNAAAVLAIGAAQAQPAGANEPKPASESTRAANRALLTLLPFDDAQSFDDARRGLVAEPGPEPILRADGRTAWSLQPYAFLASELAPDSVNPALWRHARVNLVSGLFKVADRIYQLRGFDISAMTVIEGDTGLIAIDPLVSTETASAAMALYFQHRPKRPVVAVIYTHSHVDHFGGVRGVVDEADVRAGKVQIWAPVGFMEEAVGENVIAGNAMSRRALFQFGPLLPKGERGQVDAGLGKTTSLGTVTLIPPTRPIDKPIETHRIDGIDIVFELVPGTEAPAEMIMYYPQFRVLNMAEIVTQNFHNLLPLRGALVRDPLAWSKYIGGALQRYGARSDVLIAQHHWPVWGSERIQTQLRHQRDLYKYVHDQTLRLMNAGWGPGDIAEKLRLPESLNRDWAAHGFYGTLKHNVKAIYQRYLGWYDANPANLDPLPPVAAARKAVEYMGGADAVLQRARADFARGEYRWVAQVASQLVFADPSNTAARQLGADALEQLGYQAESATWRNAYLQGASELRHGPPRLPAMSAGSPDVVRALPLELFFDYLGVRLNGERAAGKKIVLNWRFTDTGQNFTLNLDNSALTSLADAQSDAPDATVVLSRATLDEIALQKTSFPVALAAGRIAVEGRTGALLELLGLLDTFPGMFPVLEPRPAP